MIPPRSKSPGGEPALVVAGVVKQFDNHVAVDGISLEVPRGVVYGILGPNGAGKSTMLRMINDIIAPDAGAITILDGLKPGSAAAKRIGYLPEERGLYPKMRVVDMIRFVGELRGMTSAESKRRADKWLERLGLSRWANNRVQDLSKGMQQKVQFATALIHDPELVILDEPWSGLDPINAEVLRDVVDDVRASGRTVLFSTHQMEQAEKLCDVVCIIARGQKVLDGTLEELKRASSSEGVIALGFVDAAAEASAQSVLNDRSLVSLIQPGRPGGVGACEVKLVGGVVPQQLLAALVQSGVQLRRFEVMVPTLHQIFVDRVGVDAAVAQRRMGTPNESGSRGESRA